MAGIRVTRLREIVTATAPELRIAGRPVKECSSPSSLLGDLSKNVHGHHVNKDLRNCPSRIEDCHGLRIAMAMPCHGNAT